MPKSTEKFLVCYTVSRLQVFFNVQKKKKKKKKSEFILQQLHIGSFTLNVNMGHGYYYSH